MATIDTTSSKLEELLGDDADDLLGHTCQTIDKSQLYLPGPDFLDRTFVDSDRSTRTIRNLKWLSDTGRLAGTGYVSILPVDQGIEHSGGTGLISGRKAFQRPTDEGIGLLNAIQDVYLNQDITIA